MLDGRVLFEQFLDTLVGLLVEQRHGAAPLAVVEGRPPLPEEARDDRVDGGARAEEDTGDLGGREPFGGEQRNVHPQPSTRFHFALHLGDEALAFLGDNGDILHVRPFLWWLDGFGVFTMPQRTAVCSIILGIYLVSFVARVAMYMWGQEGYLQPLRIFDVGEERSIPTWFESIQFLLCSILLAVVAVAKKRRNDRYILHWGVLSIILLLLSLDEVASIHEAIGQQSERLLHNTTGFTPGGAIKFFWVVPGTIFVLIVLVAYLRFLANLPRSTRYSFLLAGALFVLGALGLEMLSAQVSSSSEGIANFFGSAVPKIMIGLQTCVEEMFEMLGLTAFVYALLAYIRSYVEDINVRVRIDKSA